MFLVVLYFLLVILLFNMAHKNDSVPLGWDVPYGESMCITQALFSCELQCSWPWVQC